MYRKLILILLLSITILGVSFGKSTNVSDTSNVSNNKVVFAYLTDLHIIMGHRTIADAQACVEDINKRDDIQFVILAGDITEFGSDDEIYKAKEILDKLDVPYYIIAGNHDSKWSESGCNTFLEVFGYESFEFEAGGIKFLGCNSGPNMRMAPALLPRESILWLEDVAKKIDPEQPVIFINHYPMDDSMSNYFQVLDILKKTNIQLIMCGHGHNDKVMDFEGVPAMMGRSNQHVGKDGPGYNIVTIDGSRIEFRERIAGGETKQAWHVLRMSKGRAFDDKAVYSRPSFAVNEKYPNVKKVWSIQDKTDIGAGAVKSGKYVVYANTAGEVKTLNAATGDVIWIYKTGGKIFSTPAIDKGRVVIGSTDKKIYCFNLSTGNIIWSYECDKSVLASPTIYGGKVYIGASDNRFRCLSLSTGKLIWAYDKMASFVEAKAFVDRAQVVIGDWGNNIYSLDTRTGKLQWKWTNKMARGYSAAAVWPVKANGKIYIVTPQRISYALRANTGFQVWKKEGGRESIGLSPDKKQVYVKAMWNTVYAFSTDDRGVMKWKNDTVYDYDIAPSAITSVSHGKGKGLVFIPTDKGDIIALDTVTGKIVWEHKLSIALINYIQPVGVNQILVSTMDGIVCLLEY